MAQSSSNFKLGNQDKLIDSFNTNEKYTINGACGVYFKGQIHFFGGWNHPQWAKNFNYENQHFGFNKNGNFVKYENLDVNFHLPQCISFNFQTKQGFKIRTYLIYQGVLKSGADLDHTLAHTPAPGAALDQDSRLKSANP